jgi:hypothetical protein
MNNCNKLISYLFHSRTQAHVFHLQTTSFAEHMALQGYYDGIVGLVDGLVESYQGKYGILKGYTNFGLIEYNNKQQVIQYFEALMSTIDTLRVDITDSYLQNQVDTITELVQSTLYKLKNLN